MERRWQRLLYMLYNNESFPTYTCFRKLLLRAKVQENSDLHYLDTSTVHFYYLELDQRLNTINTFNDI